LSFRERTAWIVVAGALAAIASVAWLAACGTHAPTAGPTDTGQGGSLDAGALTTSADGATPSSVAAVAEAIRSERWTEALALLDSLGPADKDRNEIRYARGRTLLALQRNAEAIAAFDDLEASLPLLGADIGRRRAEAELAAGPYDKAGEYFAAQPGSAAQLQASRAFEKAGDSARAMAACDRVIQMDKRTRAQEAEARDRRVRLGTRDVAAMVADARWLAVHAPDLPAGLRADATLKRLDPAAPLTGEERMKRAQALADAGKYSEALAVLSDVPGAPGKAVPDFERQRARAYVLYKSRGHYLEAAVALSSCAQSGGEHAAEDAFHAARALSRADRDESAQTAYRTVAQKYGGTSWAAEASFLAARIDLLHGRWEAAARGFDQHSKAYKSGNGREARSDRALSHLLAGHYKMARRLYEQLADGESDALGGARAATMAALAAYKDGEKTEAIGRWTDVARSHPLTWPALVARARLQQIGAPVPAPIEDSRGGEGGEPIDPPLPPPVDTLHLLGFDDDAEEALKTREAALVAALPARPTEALCEAYGHLGRAQRRFQVSQGVPSSLLATAPSPASRWAWDCAFPQPYSADVRKSAAEDGVDVALVYGVMRQESAFNPTIVSPANAYGLLQLIPDTAAKLAKAENLKPEDADEEHLVDPGLNVRLGTRYLRDLVARFDGQLPLAVAAYNAGEEAVDRWKTRGANLEVDTFVERIPYAETRTYVVKVMGNVARYGYLSRGDTGVPQVKLALE
jgi:soluble lytic murein transglycosylase